MEQSKREAWVCGAALRGMQDQVPLPPLADATPAPLFEVCRILSYRLYSRVLSHHAKRQATSEEVNDNTHCSSRCVGFGPTPSSLECQLTLLEATSERIKERRDKQRGIRRTQLHLTRSLQQAHVREEGKPKQYSARTCGASPC